MRQLSPHDAAFLYSDSGHANANVSLLHIYDQSTAPGGKVRFKEILAHIENRLGSSPVFRQKLLQVPLNLDYPYWIEDEHFELEYHVRHIALPKPGDWRQFCILASRIHARPLDLSRPLWEMYVIEGLDQFQDLPKGSFALLTKIHHAAIDVEHGSEITMLLHDTTPTPPRPAPPEPWFPEATPGTLRLALRGLTGACLAPLRLAPPLFRAMAELLPTGIRVVRDMLFHPTRMPVTRFNSIVSPHRVFETRRFDLGELREIRGLAEGATTHDAVLAVCGGGLRRYLEINAELPAASLSAIAPIAIRSDKDDPDSAMEMSWVRVLLGTDLPDPVARLAFIRDQTRSSEAIHQAVGARELTDITRHAPAATLALTSKMLTRAVTDLGRRAPLANCTVTNVPGPSVPLYLNGARMTYFSAIMPISDGMGLVFAVTSYDGKLILSPTACRDQMPDPDLFAQCVRDSFQEYLALARPPQGKSNVTPLKRARRRSS
ncbi:MAG: wax ester/triacylglycerol synthase family O-acyltransferase [Rhodocyclaceae bacterium]|nr:wax ester/triacylglycerol synthase family O-acyltransferase [Rhodocyclaceae bacterium]